MTKIKYDISLISVVPLQEGFNEWPSKIPPPCELWTIPGYLFILKEIIRHQRAKFSPLNPYGKILSVSHAVELASRSLIESQVRMWDRGMGNGKFGNLDLILWMTWGIRSCEWPRGSAGQQANVCLWKQSAVDFLLLSSAYWKAISWGR